MRKFNVAATCLLITLSLMGCNTAKIDLEKSLTLGNGAQATCALKRYRLRPPPKYHSKNQLKQMTNNQMHKAQRADTRQQNAYGRTVYQLIKQQEKILKRCYRQEKKKKKNWLFASK